MVFTCTTNVHILKGLRITYCGAGERVSGETQDGLVD